MEGKTITVQRIKKGAQDRFRLAEKYFSVLSVINDLKLTEREIQMLAFSAIKGNLTNANVRDEFCRIYHTSFPTINNMISRLRKMDVIVKTDGKIRVNPMLVLDFNNDVKLEITLSHIRPN